MENKVKGLLFRLPVSILILAGFIASIVIKLIPSLSVQYPIPWGTAVLFGILLVLYLWGEYLSFKKSNYNPF